MYAPVLFPESPTPSPAVRAFERAVLAAEGSYHVAGRYFACTDAADRMRRAEAERFEREAARYVAAFVLTATITEARTDYKTGRAA